VILERVGSGAMGVVYGAYDPELDRRIALKLLKGDDASSQGEMGRARLLREAKAMARLAHPNVIAVHDVGVFEEQVFLATEFLSGGTVRSWLAEEPRTWRQVLAVFIAAGRGLAAAHAGGLVHRDFKPENLLLDKEGRARVVDFGLARESSVLAGGGGGLDTENGATVAIARKAPVVAGSIDTPAASPAGSAASAASKDDGGAAADNVRAPGPEAARRALLDAAAREEAARQAATGNNAAAAAASRNAPATSRLDTLTRTGALMGTPAYMAPEQFLGEQMDERTDQFSFCVSLYEALFGERPFAGDTLLSLSFSVTEGQLRPLPKDRDVPTWIRRVVMRGLRKDPKERWPSMAALIAALEDDPAVRRRRRMIAAAGAVLVLASLVAAGAVVRHRRQEVERQLAQHLADGDKAGADGRAKASALRALRQRAFAAFDAPDRNQGEALWRDALAGVAAADGAYTRAAQAYEAALVLDPQRGEVRARLADLLNEHLLLAEELRRDDRASALAAALAGHDTDGSRRKALEAPGTLALHTTPSTTAIVLERYERDAGTGRRTSRPAGGGAFGLPLPPGSYRLLIRADGRAPVIFPFELRRGQKLAVDLALPPATAVPAGYVHVPPGELWYGDGDEKLRKEFLDTAPIHKRRTEAFLIALRETTYREWIAFLEALPAAERVRHQPDVSIALRGSLRLFDKGGAWQLAFQPTSQRYQARAGEVLAYEGRTKRARQDWLEFPVAGISPADADRYLAWLRDTGRVPGARLCTEVEWERAARGADERAYPHGDELGPDDANFDVTYGRVDTAFGPDVVGSYSASQSPFGIDDMAGNVLELVRSAESAGGFVIRGGAYIFNSATCRITNRNVIPATFRDVTTGIRVCASV
jgi:serine/threonine protein kinase/formylglycine-generating enzyme required for sulfatase activity